MIGVSRGWYSQGVARNGLNWAKKKVHHIMNGRIVGRRVLVDSELRQIACRDATMDSLR